MDALEISFTEPREKQIKRWKRQWKINLIESNNPQWINLSYELF